MNSNQETLGSYESHVQEYIDGTPQEVGSFVKQWIDTTLQYIPQTGSILELGSAFGRDADYIESQGFQVNRTDATQGFVDLLRAKGYIAKNLNAISDPLGGPYDLIFADAVLLHFTEGEFRTVLNKVRNTLTPNGIFSFSVKQGRGSEWSSDKLGAPRFFQYWEAEVLKNELTHTQFTIVNFGSDEQNKWWHVIAQKES